MLLPFLFEFFALSSSFDLSLCLGLAPILADLLNLFTRELRWWFWCEHVNADASHCQHQHCPAYHLMRGEPHG
jgi:hypothetical protein